MFLTVPSVDGAFSRWPSWGAEEDAIKEVGKSATAFELTCQVMTLRFDGIHARHLGIEHSSGSMTFLRGDRTWMTNAKCSAVIAIIAHLLNMFQLFILFQVVKTEIQHP